MPIKILIIEDNEQDIHALKDYLARNTSVPAGNITDWRYERYKDNSDEAYTCDEQFERIRQERASESWADNDIILIDVFLLGNTESGNETMLSQRIFRDLFCKNEDFCEKLEKGKKRVVFLTKEGHTPSAFDRNDDDKPYSRIHKPKKVLIRKFCCQARWCKEYPKDEAISVAGTCQINNCLKNLIITFEER